MYLCVVVQILPLSTICYWILQPYQQCGIFPLSFYHIFILMLHIASYIPVLRQFNPATYQCSACNKPDKILNIFIIEIYSSDYYLWFLTGTLVSSTNKTDRHNIAEIVLNVALNTISQLLLNQMFSSFKHRRSLSILANFVMAIIFFLLPKT